MRLNCILQDLFRDTPLDHNWHAQIRAQIRPNTPNTVFGVGIYYLGSQIWPSGVSLKRSCKMPKCSLEANPYQERRLVIPTHVTWSIPNLFGMFQLLNLERCQPSCMPPKPTHKQPTNGASSFFSFFRPYLDFSSFSLPCFLRLTQLSDGGGLGWACVGHGTGVRINE